MKVKYLLLLLSLCCILSASNCKKDDAPQDYIVREGNQAFGAYLNGKPWIADYRDAGNGIGPISVRMVNGGITPHVDDYNYLWVIAQKNNEEISLYIPPPLIPGRKLLNATTYPWPSVIPAGTYGMYNIYSPSKIFMTNSSVTGYIDILNADTVQRTIEGRFEFEAINTSTSEKVKVTNGYFKK